MKVEIRKELAERKPLADVVKAAMPVLEAVIGRRAAQVTATWGFHADERGNPVIALSLADWSEHVSADFTSEELRRPDIARRRISHLWGDLLQQASERLSRELEAAAAEGTQS